MAIQRMEHSNHKPKRRKRRKYRISPERQFHKHLETLIEEKVNQRVGKIFSQLLRGA